jgi:hypothetical protein
MDAGVIAAFKCHYRRRHSKWAVTQADLGKTDIYKVHVLQAMVWSRRAWNSIEPGKIRNCFYRTKLFGDINEIPSINNQLQEVRDEIEVNMRQLPITQQIPIDSFINPEDENENVHIQLSDTEMLNLRIERNALRIITGMDGADRADVVDGEDEEGEDEEGDDDEEDEEKDAEPPPATRKEILAAFDLAMSYINGEQCPIELPDEGDTYASTLKSMKGWREALHKSMLANMTQPTLTSFFRPSQQ